MRVTTEIAMKAVSVGRPKLGQVFEPTPWPQQLMALAEWMKTVDMGKCIRITIGRTVEEVERMSGSTSPQAEDTNELLAAFNDQMASLMGTEATDGPAD